MPPRNQREPATLAAKFGFQDAELTTPEHDAMVMWADARLRDQSLVNELCGWHYSRMGELALREQLHELWWAAHEAAEAEGVDTSEWRRPSEHVLPDLERPRLGKVTWEQPVGDARWVAGFVDIYCRVAVPLGVYVAAHYGARDELLPREPQFRRSGVQDLNIALEIKPHIRSLGELVRQVRFYEAKGLGDAVFYVVAGGDALREYGEHLLQQRIGLIEYPSGKSNAWVRFGPGYGQRQLVRS
jgi:hypothetical protein